LALKVKNLKKNTEGYFDPTAYEAIRNVDKESIKFHRLLETIFYICDIAGFKIEERIVVRNKKTGRIWR